MTQSNGKEQQPEHSQQDSLQRTIQIGQSASELLGSPVFNLAYQNMMTRLHGEWMTSQPKEERKRESLWMQAKGLEQVTLDLYAAVEEAQRVAQESAQRHDPKAQESDYLNAQGYGLNLN